MLLFFSVFAPLKVITWRCSTVGEGRTVPASYVVACAVILQVLDFRPLVTMTANSYMVFGFRPVMVWLRAVVSADWKHICANSNQFIFCAFTSAADSKHSNPRLKVNVLISSAHLLSSSACQFLVFFHFKNWFSFEYYWLSQTRTAAFFFSFFLINVTQKIPPFQPETEEMTPPWWPTRLFIKLNRVGVFAELFFYYISVFTSRDWKTKKSPWETWLTWQEKSSDSLSRTARVNQRSAFFHLRRILNILYILIIISCGFVRTTQNSWLFVKRLDSSRVQ